MKGKQEVIDVLNDVLGAELVAINQYFLHAKLCESWGLARLAATTRAESIDEMRHAESLVDRILHLEGLPNLQKLDKLRIGETVKQQLQADLELEMVAVDRLNRGLRVCYDHSDATSGQLLQSILESEELHVDFLETQLSLIERIGEANYLAHQVGPE